MDLDVAGMLEGIVAEELEIPHLDIAAVHEDIVRFVRLHVLDVDAFAGPEGLLRMRHRHAAQPDVRALAEHLGRLLPAVAQLHPAAVPERGARAFGEMAAGREEMLTAPEDIFPFKAAVVRLDVGTFLDGGLPGVDGDALETQAVPVVERPLAAEFPVDHGFHAAKIRKM